jgi:ethanolamine ammonia-lyase large subunit
MAATEKVKHVTETEFSRSIFSLVKCRLKNNETTSDPNSLSFSFVDHLRFQADISNVVLA